MEASSSRGFISATLQSRLDIPSLFMFVRTDKGRYILYRIAVIALRLRNVRDAELLPLIVFKRSVLPNCECGFAFIEPKFYIIGENKDEVFTLDKHQLLNLELSQTSRGSEFLEPITKPMLGKKSNPLAFAYNDKLYIISKQGSHQAPQQHSFEVYSPSNHTWTDLFPKPLWESSIKAHVILETFVYFTMSNDCVMSFNLGTSNWSTVYDPYGVLYIYKHMFPQYTHPPPPPTFDSQIQVFGNAIIGAVSHTHTSLPYFGIYASKLRKPFEKSFLRPTLDVGHDFECATVEPPYPLDFIIDRDSPRYSRYILNYDGFACLVFYGNSPMEGDSFANHAAVTFFNISLEGSSFDARVSFNTNLHINSGRKFTYGTICSCIFA